MTAGNGYRAFVDAFDKGAVGSGQVLRVEPSKAKADRQDVMRYRVVARDALRPMEPYGSFEFSIRSNPRSVLQGRSWYTEAHELGDSQ